MPLDNLRKATGAFHVRLREMGFRSYSGYLKSDRWRKTKAKWRALKGNDRCYICGKGNTLPHHASYERLGNERIKDGWRGKADLVPLCGLCHTATHHLLDLWIARHGDIGPGKDLSTAHIELRKSYRSLLHKGLYREMARKR